MGCYRSVVVLDPRRPSERALACAQALSAALIRLSDKGAHRRGREARCRDTRRSKASAECAASDCSHLSQARSNPAEGCATLHLRVLGRGAGQQNGDPRPHAYAQSWPFRMCMSVHGVHRKEMGGGRRSRDLLVFPGSQIRALDTLGFIQSFVTHCRVHAHPATSRPHPRHRKPYPLILMPAFLFRVWGAGGCPSPCAWTRLLQQDETAVFCVLPSPHSTAAFE
ncbi:hypothetical protein FB451DRAFT_63261 [Mycena latifolia]|nr:hypothetical protein FB451DRAFT_63261 [Mycena latifolia]